MQPTLHFTTTVLPGNRIEITAPELKEGDSVEVILRLLEARTAPSRSALEIIQSLQGHRLFCSPDEVDRYLREERDSWER